MPELPMNSDALIGRIEQLLGRSSSDSTSRPADRPPPTIANYQLLAGIGSGSYGDVWLARGVTGALHAIKVVWRSRFDSDRPYEREFRGIVKFEPISRSHPGSINILHVGRDDAAGYFYYAMELADAVADAEGQPDMEPADSKSPAYIPRTLASDLKAQTRLPVMEVVALGVQLAGAVGHLHRNGLVHRDIKPSNVIFVRGQPKLADIGLVTELQDDRSFVGTEGYIPPEGPGTERADLYALGRLLYESTTGLHRSEFPSLPSDLDRWPKTEREQLIDLSEVLARACAPDPKNRHANAAELAGDLNLILAGRSVRKAYRIERHLRRARMVSIAALVVVLVAVASSYFQRQQRELADGQARRESVLREESQRSLIRAETAEREARQVLFTALSEQARATVLTSEMGHRVRALEAVRQAVTISNSATLRGIALAALSLPDLRFERELPVPPAIQVARLDPAFERLALAQYRGPIEIRAVKDHRLLATLPASSGAAVWSDGLWSGNGRFFAISRHDPKNPGAVVEVWNLKDIGDVRRVLLLRASSSDSYSFHPALPRILVGDFSGAAVTYDLDTGRQISSLQLESKAKRLEYSPDAGAFAVLIPETSGSQLVVRHADDGAIRFSHEFTNMVHAFKWHPSGRWIAVVDSKGGVFSVDATTGGRETLGRHKSDATVVEFSPDGRYLFSGGWDHELICWDTMAMRRAFTVSLDAHHLQFRSDGEQCSIARLQNQARLQLHAFERPALHRDFAGDLGGPRGSAAFSPDGRWLAAAGDERTIVWDLLNDGPGAVLKGQADTRVSFAASGELFINPRGGGSRWRIHPGATTTSPPRMERLAFPKPAGMFGFCLASNGIVFTGRNGSRLTPLDSLPGDGNAWAPTRSGLGAVSPDGRWLGMQVPFDPRLDIHRIPDFELVATITNEYRVSQFQFSPWSDEVAVGSRNGVEFWSTATWRRTRHLAEFREIFYSPNAKTFWLARDKFKSAGLHDAKTAELLLPLPPNTRPVAVSQDGRYLAVSVDARRIQVWDLREVAFSLQALDLAWTAGR